MGDRSSPPKGATHCPYCALQCGIALVRAHGRSAVVPRRDFPVNRGALGIKGWTAAQTLDHPDRLRTPLLRDDGVLRPASWDEALDLVATRFQETQAGHGRHAVGVLGGGSLTNETAYLLGKFARVALATPNVDYNGRFCMSSAAAASINAFGLDRGLPFPLEDVAQTELILLVGSNLAETMPPACPRGSSSKQHGC